MADSLSFKDLALACVAAHFGLPADGNVEALYLDQRLSRVPGGAAGLPEAFAAALSDPAPQDAQLAALHRSWKLTPVETLSIALAAAVDEDLRVGRALAFVQTPLGGSRPTLGLLAEVFATTGLEGSATAAKLAESVVFRAGLMATAGDLEPLAERPVAVPPAVARTLAGIETEWPGGTSAPGATIPLGAKMIEQCGDYAKLIESPTGRPLLVLRSAALDEARSVAVRIAAQLDREPFFSDLKTPLPGFGAWLEIRERIPVFLLDPAPGETQWVPAIPHYEGPVMAIAGVDGGVGAPWTETVQWSLPMPDPEEREALWRLALAGQRVSTETIKSSARTHRQGAARIAQIGRLAVHHARLHGRQQAHDEDVTAVQRSGEGSGLESLAQLVNTEISDDAFKRSKDLDEALQQLLGRCRNRDGLSRDLGASAQARYNPGVRALFTGSSGTGKTLAASWIATQLGLPLCRVDPAAITSKYIGETEQNLSRLLARAERTEVVLLFDEADALFGQRTDIRDANDRFANAQTNYLLQRIETFDGIALLTSNSRSRFDSAFMRRLDLVIEFPLPGPAERRELWISHLGENALTPTQLNLLAGQCDFTGGQIRNVVLAAAVSARADAASPSFAQICAALVAEYRKAGRTAPEEFTKPNGKV
jgi:hypothetical protein